jgi:hypothetical protein
LSTPLVTSKRETEIRGVVLLIQAGLNAGAVIDRTGPTLSNVANVVGGASVRTLPLASAAPLIVTV